MSAEYLLEAAPPPSVPPDLLWDAITQALSTHGSAATFTYCDHPNCLWLRNLGFGPVPSAPASPDDFDTPEDPQRTLDILAGMLGWENTPPRRIFEQEITLLKRAFVSANLAPSVSAPPAQAPKKEASLIPQWWKDCGNAGHQAGIADLSSTAWGYSCQTCERSEQVDFAAASLGRGLAPEGEKQE